MIINPQTVIGVKDPAETDHNLGTGVTGVGILKTLRKTCQNGIKLTQILLLFFLFFVELLTHYCFLLLGPLKMQNVEGLLILRGPSMDTVMTTAICRNTKRPHIVSDALIFIG